MSVEANKAIALRYWEAWKTGNLAIIDEIFATDYVFHDAAGGVGRGRERPKRGIMSYRTAFPDLHFLWEPVFAGEDKVTVRWTAYGTHSGDIEMVLHLFGGVRKESQKIPPTGKPVTWSSIDIYHLTDGKIVESWRSLDRLGFLQQLGVVSA
jgi:predicted ester cyclase